MRHPFIEPQFIRTPHAEARAVFHSFTRGICPYCRELLDAARILRGRDLLGRRSVRYDGGSP